MNRSKDHHALRRGPKKLQQVILFKEVTSYRPERYALPRGYLATPSQQQIFAADGQIRDLIIKNNHGKAYWRGSINLSRLEVPLSQTVFIGERVIEVYVADRGKPSFGEELNRPCVVTFHSSFAIPTEDLAMICRANNTKLMSNNPLEHQFSILIPHFTRYSFTDPDKKKQNEKIPQGRQSEMTLRTVRSRIIQEQPAESLPLTSISRQQEVMQDSVTYMQESTNNNNFVLEGVKDYILHFSQIKEKERLMPKLKLEQDKDLLEAYNNNRALFGFQPYKSSLINVPALHNYMFSPEGTLAQLKTYENRQKIIFLQRQQQTAARQSNWNQLLLLNETLTPEKLVEIICDSEMEVSFRRKLALHSILFMEKNYFYFNKQRNYQPCITTPFKLNNFQRQQLIKDWLAWVIKRTYSQEVIVKRLPFKSKLMAALALRSPQLAQDYLIVNNRWQTAQILSKLENDHFQAELFEQKLLTLQPELKMVLSNTIEDFKCSDWLLVLALSCWYFKLMSFDEILKQVIYSEQLRSKIFPSFSMEFKLFEIYAETKRVPLKFELYHDPKPMIDDICFQWLLINRLDLSKMQQKIWISERTQSKGKFMFQHFNYKITEQIVKGLGWSRYESALKVIDMTLNLSEREKYLLSDLVNKSSQEKIQKMEDLLQEQQYIEALKFCLQHREMAFINKTLLNLVVHPAILLPLNQQNKQRIITLLESHPDLSDISLVIRFDEDDTLNTDHLNRVMQIAEQGKTRLLQFVNKFVRGAIVCKIETKIRSWIEKKNGYLSELLRQKKLLDRVKKEIQDQELLNLLASKEQQQS